MRTIVKIFTSLSFLTKKLGICANVGLIAGAIAGTFLVLLNLLQGGLVVNNEEALYLGLILTGFTWIVILFILCMLVRFTLGSVALASFVNCLLTCLLTVFVCKWINAFHLAWLIGIVLGIIVGQLLCRLNYLFQLKKTLG